MFIGFHSMLRSAGLKVGLGEWLAVVEALDKEQVQPSMADLYRVARALVCRDEGDYDRYDQAFAAYFEGTPLPPELDARLRDWLSAPIERPPLTDEEPAELQRYNLDELRRLYEERLAEQDERHDGGDKWVGTGGKSPFGQGGQHPSGMRVGEGAQSRGSAVAGARKRRFREYRSDRVLDTRAIAVALRRLRRLERQSRRFELDIDATIRATARNGGDIEVAMRPERRNQARVVLLLDTGGSMEPHTRAVEAFFSALKNGGGLREVVTYHFHNCVYDKLFTDVARFDYKPIEDVLRSVPPHTHLVVVGDAWMAPYELFSPGGSIEIVTSDHTPGIERLEQLANAFDRHVWLNPIGDRYWQADTIAAVGELFPMFPMTVDGIVEAVSVLLGTAKRKEGRRRASLWHDAAQPRAGRYR